MSLGRRVRGPYRWAVVAYDRLYRSLHGLDRPEAEVGPALRVEVRTCRRMRSLPGPTILRRGDRIGILHVNNERIAALHADGLAPLAVGLEFRRQFVASLRALARLVAGGDLGDVRAFAATTIAHAGLTRLGFTPEPRGVVWPRLVAVYQRSLLASLRPRPAPLLRGAGHHYARRLWLTRETLLARYGPGRGEAA